MSGNLNIVENLPTTTVHVARLQIAQPTRRPEHVIRKIETPWGNAVIDGKIGQPHIDVLEAIFWEAKDSKELFIDEQNGEESKKILQILVDPYKVRLSAGGASPMSWTQLNAITKDLRRVLIDLTINAQGRHFDGNLITEIEYSKFVETKKGGFLKKGGEERRMWKVTFGHGFTTLMGEDLKLKYDPRPIAMLRKGVSQALVRHVKTHRAHPRGGWHLDSLLKVVGVEGDSVSRANRRRELKEDLALMSRLGVHIKDGRVFKTGDMYQ